MKTIIFTVTNDLVYDQRMQRICGTLARNGYRVTLVGRKRRASLPVPEWPFKTRRLRCFYNRGAFFYSEFNVRLFIYLLFHKADAVCAVDLDTIMPCAWVSRWRKRVRIYDAHELFTEMKEVITRPAVHRVWLGIEKKMVPRFRFGYTVSEGIAEEFQRRYGVSYATIRNLPEKKQLPPRSPRDKFLLYIGAVNDARGFENLVPAMKQVNCRLVVCGDGNFMARLRKLVRDNAVEDKVELRGMLTPDALWAVACQAYIGIHVPEQEGLNQYLALPNKFFEYLHAGLPQVTVNYPEYRRLNDRWRVAVLLDTLSPGQIAEAVNNLLENTVLYDELHANCLAARESLNWQEEEKKLLAFYQSVFKV